ncbi:Fc.00g022020.m01.CDS01 [Cosmosporella sp. VM-42]
MQLSHFITASALPAALAQYGESSSLTTTAAASSSSSAAVDGVHIVKVGDGGLTFEPAEVTAEVGDKVEFHFYPMAHSVAQASFDAPCQPLNTTGFFSGPVAVKSGMSDEVFTVEVKDTKPLWFYCATAKHCQGGMVGVVNAPSDGKKTLEQFAAAAADAEENTAPSSTGGGTLGSATTATSTGGASSTDTTKPNAGLQARGDIRWGLMSAGVALAGFVGGMMI